VVRLVVAVGVGVFCEDVLQVPFGWLIPKVLFSRSHLAVVDLFFARTAARWGAVSRRLLTSLAGAFADAFCEINNLATLRDAVATFGMYRARAAVTLCVRERLLRSPRPPVVAATTSAVYCSFS
jgi:hypothetical protein